MSGEKGVPLNAPALLEVLERYRVQYVVVGGYAAELHGSLRRTVDVDVVPSTTVDNLDRLGGCPARDPGQDSDGRPARGAAVLPAGGGHGGGDHAQPRHDPRELDVNFTPSGTTGYDDLQAGATGFDVGRVRVQVASLADVIRSKTAAGRPKDFAALPELFKLAGSTNSGPAPLEPTPRTAPEYARAGYPEPVQALSPQELAQARINAARQQAAASRADTSKRKPPPA